MTYIAEHPASIWVQYSDNGLHIRKWALSPFEGAREYCLASRDPALPVEVEAEADTWVEQAATRMARIAAIPESMIDTALKAIVPGGAQVASWLPQQDAWTPHQTARDVIRAALFAVLSEQRALRLPAEQGWRSMDDAPHGVPILARYHPWKKPENGWASHVVWYHKGDWRRYPGTEGTGYAIEWRPLPAAPAEVEAGRG